MRTLQFSIGPVQGFVAQARRTRDFWAGSFILSYLAGHAILAVIENKGKMIIPAVSDDGGNIIDQLLLAIQQRRECASVSKPPKIATLPNRFQAQVPEDFAPCVCVEAVKRAWIELAGGVWQDYLQPVAQLGRNTQEIWERQINGFWEIVWVIGDDPVLLDRRKNWRTHVPPLEPGDKCTLMGNMQELSGYLRIREREQQDKFWEALRKQAGDLNLAENERLCSIALVKRLFPLVAEKNLWKVPQLYPSTPYLAAVPWLAKVCLEKPEEARQYAAKAAPLAATSREYPDRFACLRDALVKHPEARDFASLNGNCFFKASLDNPNIWENGSGKRSTSNLRKELVEKLKIFDSSPPPFFAMLVMDGDRLGALLGECQKERISEALLAFSKQVEQLVKENDGVTVFAGGDDVLALFPAGKAIPAAIKLREAYAGSFANTGVTAGKGTISGAIVYAHFTTPLTAVYREAHRLLDDVAKEETGRNSLAVAVWKGTGNVLTWSAPWDLVKEGLLEYLVNAFRGKGWKDKEYNSSFFYNLRARFSVLEGEKISLKEEEIVDIFAAEYLKSRERKCTKEEARERVEKMLKICRRYFRNEETGNHQAANTLVFDGALLVKFLAETEVV